MIIRDMTSQDWEAVKEIYQQGIDTNLATFVEEPPTYEEWDLSHHAFCRLVAARENKVIGFVCLSPVSPRPLYCGVAEMSVYIHNDYKRMGVGKALIQAVIPLSEESGIWTLYSSVFENNLASLALHKCCGFRIIGSREKLAQDKYGMWRNTILLERRSRLEKYN